MRESDENDAEFAFELNNDSEVLKYTGDPPFESIESAKMFLKDYDSFRKYGMGRWYVFTNENDQFLGWCGLKYTPEKDEVDVGYRFLKRCWGQGYASEAARACLEYGFEQLGLEEIVARADLRNPASIRVMEKIGMEFHEEIDFDGLPGVKYVARKKSWV